MLGEHPAHFGSNYNRIGIRVKANHHTRRSLDRPVEFGGGDTGNGPQCLLQRFGREGQGVHPMWSMKHPG